MVKRPLGRSSSLKSIYTNEHPKAELFLIFNAFYFYYKNSFFHLFIIFIFNHSGHVNTSSLTNQAVSPYALVARIASLGGDLCVENLVMSLWLVE
jgi:hypothetical protein